MSKNKMTELSRSDGIERVHDESVYVCVGAVKSDQIKKFLPFINSKV